MNKSNQFSNTEGTILERIKQVSADGGGRKYPEWDEDEIISILSDFFEEFIVIGGEESETEIKYAHKLIDYFTSEINMHDVIMGKPDKIKICIVYDSFIGFNSYETEVTTEYFESIADRLKGHGKIQIGGYIGDKTAIRRVYVVEEETK